MNLLALSWLTEIGLMQYRAATQGRPVAAGGGKVLWPSDLVASFIVYGGLSVVAEISPEWSRAAAGFGWVLVLATWLNLVDPTLAGAQKQAQLTSAATGANTTTGTPTNSTVTQAHKAQ